MTPEDIVAVDADEAFDIEYELRGRHNPIEHAGEPCGGGCCTCTRDGCDAMWALSLLTRERKMLAAAQERIAALEAALWDYANPDNWQTTDLYEFPDLWIVRGENGCDRARAALAGSQGGGGEEGRG